MSGAELMHMIAPELTLLVGACLVLLIGVSRAGRAHFVTGWLALATIVVALLISWNASPYPRSGLGMRAGDLVWYVRLIALSVGAVVLLVNWQVPRPQERGDVFAMILFSLTGILVTALADDLVLLFMALELVSVPTYVLVATSRSDIRAEEAAIKYFFLGALASALMVYGFSFLFGASGTTRISTMVLNAQGGYATLGLVLAFAGLAYKIAAVPFHVYVADVYQGAASPITGLLGFFPKLAGFVAIAKLLWIMQPADPVKAGWDMTAAAFAFLWIVSAATMTIGNVLGLLQTNVKRMLAYSSIAHSGYMLIGVLVGPVTGGAALRDGLSAMLFYIVVYGLMNLGVFAILAIVSADGKPIEELDDLAGLARQRPGSALALAICVFSLMGMPLTAGFIGKVYIISTALSAGSTPHHTALVVLAVIAVINSAIAAAYYMRIVAACYIREPLRYHLLWPDSYGLQLGVIVCCAAVLLLGVWPQGLMTMARRPFHDPQAAVLVSATAVSEPGSASRVATLSEPGYVCPVARLSEPGSVSPVATGLVEARTVHNPTGFAETGSDQSSPVATGPAEARTARNMTAQVDWETDPESPQRAAGFSPRGPSGIENGFFSGTSARAEARGSFLRCHSNPTGFTETGSDSSYSMSSQ